MSSASVFHKVREAIVRFAGARNGNIAVTFALSAIPIISFVGAAIDYTRANAARSSMQAALDPTALMLSKDLSSGTINSSQISAKASAYFNALYNNKVAQSVSITSTYTAARGSTAANIKLDGSGQIVTDFMRIASFPTMNFTTSSTTTWGNVRMRVSLVLDVTGSMADDGKMNALRPAAKSLVDQLSALAANGDIYISIVPFAKDVNLGTSYKSASWIDWTDWDANNGYSTCTAWNSRGRCTSSYWTPNDHSTWNGCMTDRTQDYDTKNTAPTTANTATLFPADQYSYRNSGTTQIATIMPLSYDWTALNAKIDTLVPTGNTNQGIGLAWGWMTLTQSDPFNAPAKDPNYVLQGRARDPVGRLEHAESLVHQRLADRRAAADPVRQRQGRRPHDLRCAGQHRRRPDVGGAAILRVQRQLLLPDHLGLADGFGVQPDRHPALQAARLEISAADPQTKKKPGSRAGLFHYSKTKDQLPTGENFATRPSRGLKVCLARSP